MGNKIKATLLALSLAVLAGCSSTPTGLDRTALAANKIASVDLTSPATITYTRSNAGSRATSVVGGLVGAGPLLRVLVGKGVDASINMNRANTASTVVKALGNYNTNEVFRRKLAALKGPSFAPGLKVNAHAVPVESSLNVLNVATNYVLSSNHQAVSVNATAKIKPSEKSSIYAKRFAANSPINMGVKAGERINATDWLTKNPSKLKQAIELGMDSIIQQISVDINTGTTAK